MAIRVYEGGSIALPCFALPLRLCLAFDLALLTRRTDVPMLPTFMSGILEAPMPILVGVHTDNGAQRLLHTLEDVSSATCDYNCALTSHHRRGVLLTWTMTVSPLWGPRLWSYPII